MSNSRVVKVVVNEAARGPVGAAGQSAYELAVANGFVGTEVEWLASLGSGGGGGTGADGASAYEIAVTNGFVGNEAAWLASLEGTPGNNGSPGAAASVSIGTTSTGAPGSSASVTNIGTSSAAVLDFTIPRGATGDTGSTGSAGLSAYEIAVANGFVGGEAAWLVSLEGADGAPGASGANGLDGVGILTVTSTTSHTPTLGTKVFTIAAPTSLVAGMEVAVNGDPNDDGITMRGIIAVASLSSLTIVITAAYDLNEAGSSSNWRIFLTGPKGEIGATGQNAGQRLDFAFGGILSVQAGVLNQVSPNYACTISEILIYANSGPVGSNIIVDVKINGTTIFANAGLRPFIAPGAPTAYSNGTGLSISMPARSRVTVDIVQVGSTTPGSNLSAAIVFART
ncbi:MAG: hypothetical protein ACRC5T_03540 [Cetobacterium sp.]